MYISAFCHDKFTSSLEAKENSLPKQKSSVCRCYNV